MMKKTLRSRGRARLRGWLRALPLLGIPFCIFMAQIAMNIQIIHNGYRMGEIRSEIRAAGERIQELKTDRASMESVEKMGALAPDLGLVEARYEQIKIVREEADPTKPGGILVEPSYQLAEAPIATVQAD